MDKLPPDVKKPSMAKNGPDRAERLAEALRANLRRRKAQAREAADDAPPQGERDRKDGDQA